MGLKTLKRRTLESATWTLIGYASSQVLRLASNLLLTRFLAPEHFGVMAIVNVFMIGLAMFSDIGIGPSVIHSKHGKDRAFLDTAWTMQVMRGVALWMFCLVAAWPLAIFYHEPLLLWLIPINGLTALISGFNSTALITSNRELDLARVTKIDIASQFLTLVVMLLIAMFSHSVWVLVAGALFSALLKLIFSHVFFTDVPNRFFWDKTYAKALMHYGKWIFFSTCLSFVTNSSASMILGKFVTIKMVGLFSIGATLSKIVEQVCQQLSMKVIFPVFVHIRDMSADEIRRKAFKIRVGVMAAFLPPLWVMTIFGQQLIDFLFDSRYHDAGWVFRVFSAGSIPMVISGLGSFFLAMGDSMTLLKLSTFKFICFLSAVFTGWWISGPDGMIVGMALYTFPVYLSDVYIQIKHNVWIGWLDLIGYLLSALILFVGIRML